MNEVLVPLWEYERVFPSETQRDIYKYGNINKSDIINFLDEIDMTLYNLQAYISSFSLIKTDGKNVAENLKYKRNRKSIIKNILLNTDLNAVVRIELNLIMNRDRGKAEIILSKKNSSSHQNKAKRQNNHVCCEKHILNKEECKKIFSTGHDEICRLLKQIDEEKMTDMKDKIVPMLENHSELISKYFELLDTVQKQKNLEINDNIKKKITYLLHKIGIPANMNGFRYIRTALLMIYEDSNLLNQITTRLYPELAEIYNTTYICVERCIRYAIDYAWKYGNKDLLNEMFEYTIVSSKKNLKNSEFLSLLTDEIKLSENINKMGE